MSKKVQTGRTSDLEIAMPLNQNSSLISKYDSNPKKLSQVCEFEVPYYGVPLDADVFAVSGKV